MRVGHVHLDPLHFAFILNQTHIAAPPPASIDVGACVLEQELDEMGPDKSGRPRDNDPFSH